MLLIRFLGAENPFVTAFQAVLGFIQIKESESQSVAGAGGIVLYAVIDHQPALWSFDRRRGETDLVRVSPATEPPEFFCGVPNHRVCGT
jgi:hypothetical protein